MTILVTTPRGKVGQEVVSLLRERRAPIRIGAHSVEATRQQFPGVEVARLNYRDAASVFEALRGIEAVYLAAPGDAPADPEQRFVDVARASGVKKIVKLSALGVEQSDSPLRQVEQHIEASGLAWTLLRPTWFSQNFSTTHAAAIKAGTLAEPAGSGKTAFIDTRDIAAVAVEALLARGHEGKAYALTGPEALDREQVVHILSSILDRPVRYAPLSDEEFRAGAREALTPSYLELLSWLYGAVRAGATEVTTPDVQRVLGRPPRSFEQFARDHRSVWL